MVSPLEVALNFLDDFGFFRVVVPFLLVFTLVFAVLQKTKILGSEKDKASNKNIDSLVAFAIAMFVVAAGNIVEIIRTSLPMVMVVLLLLISFMMLVGTLVGSTEFKLENPWHIAGFVFFILSAILLIFAGSIKDKNGQSWLEIAWDYIRENWFSGPVVSGILLAGMVFLVIMYVTGAFDNLGKKGG